MPIKRTGITFCIGLLAVAFVLPVPIVQPTDPLDASVLSLVLLSAALKWLIQFTAVAIGILAVFGSNIPRPPKLFAAMTTFMFGAIWWGGLSGTLGPRPVLDAALELLRIETELASGSANAVDTILFTFIGPIVGGFTLRGPFNMQGWEFASTTASTSILFGYLLFVGCRFDVGGRNHSAKHITRFAIAIVPVYLLFPLLRLATDFFSRT